MSTTDLVVDSEDIEFCLFEWLDIGQLRQFDRYADFDEETLRLLVTEGLKFSVEVVSPTNREADREGCSVVDGHAQVPQCLHPAYRQAYELGWASVTASQEHGGQGAPEAIGLALSEATVGGNLALSMYFGLTQGAMELIESFGNDALKDLYCEKMTTGEFTGTMCLSEPQAGSDVGAGKTSAELVEGNTYRIRGSKCWISSGDNDLGSNVIHLVLARVEGDPPGTRGLSLFVVPKIRGKRRWQPGRAQRRHPGVTGGQDGHQGERHRGAQLRRCRPVPRRPAGGARRRHADDVPDDEHRAHHGRRHGAGHRQRRLPERARLRPGTASRATTSTVTARTTRLAWPSSSTRTCAISLTSMKARVEAIRALLYGACFIEDRMHVTEDAEERQELDDLFQILTPMCKGWACETGLDVTRTGMQMLGGVGFTKDFPMEQYYRDLRISAIYEGTTGIQALDLVGRKMTTAGGRLFLTLLGKFGALFDEHKDHPRLGADFALWKAACDRMTECSMAFPEMMKERGLSGAVLYATPFMFLLAAVTAGYFLLQQGLVAHERLQDADEGRARFYQNKLTTLDYFLNVMLPRYQSYAVPILNRNYSALDIEL